MRRCALLRHIVRPNLAGKKEERQQEDNLLTAQSDTDYANWTSVFNFIYGCLADSAEAHEVKIVILWWGFDVLLREQMGGGFAEKLLRIECVLNKASILCYIFYELSHQ